ERIRKFDRTADESLVVLGVVPTDGLTDSVAELVDVHVEVVLDLAAALVERALAAHVHVAGHATCDLVRGRALVDLNDVDRGQRHLLELKLAAGVDAG